MGVGMFLTSNLTKDFKMGYPRRVYTKNGVHVRVETPEQYAQLGDFWHDAPIDGVKVELRINQAIEMVGEAKKEAKPKKNKEDLKDVDYKELNWDELRDYGKKLEKKFKVELPLRSKRFIIETAIGELLDGND